MNNPNLPELCLGPEGPVARVQEQLWGEANLTASISKKEAWASPASLPGDKTQLKVRPIYFNVNKMILKTNKIVKGYFIKNEVAI